MGRFASTVEFYGRYREPYAQNFFSQVARELGLRGDENLLDVGCGPGLLALGFAAYVGAITAIDPEAGMIEAAKSAAATANIAIRFVPAPIEQFPCTDKFDVVTIGRALHWLDREAAIVALNACVAETGAILICGSFTMADPTSPWVKPYDAVRRSWAEGDEKRYHLDTTTWFEGSGFDEVAAVSVTERRQVTIPELIGRALSKSNTSPAVLGDKRAEFERAIVSTIQPYVKDGILEERLSSRATVFKRAR